MLTVPHRHRTPVKRSPLSAQITTDEYGRIVEVCDGTPAVLNLSPRGAQGRLLPLFVEKDRPALMRQLKVAAGGHVVVLETVLRPLGRQARRATLRISRLDRDGPTIELRWHIELT